VPKSCWLELSSLYLDCRFIHDQFAAVSSFAKTVSAYACLLQDLYLLEHSYSILFFLSLVWMVVSILWYLGHKYLR